MAVMDRDDDNPEDGFLKRVDLSRLSLETQLAQVLFDRELQDRTREEMIAIAKQLFQEWFELKQSTPRMGCRTPLDVILGQER